MTTPNWNLALQDLPTRCDVLVVGAGPSGSACAKLLAEAGHPNGIKVKLLNRAADAGGATTQELLLQSQPKKAGFDPRKAERIHERGHRHEGQHEEGARAGL